MYTNEELLQKIRQCGQILHRVPDGRMGQRRILGILQEKGELPQKELQDTLNVRSASMSEILKKLEGEGLIERAQDPADKRTVRVKLSEEGAQVADALSRAWQKRSDELFSCLTAEEKEQLGQSLGKLTDHWSKTFVQDEDDDRPPFPPFPPFGGPDGPHRPGPGGRRGPRPDMEGHGRPPMEDFRGEGPGRGPQGHGGPEGHHRPEGFARGGRDHHGRPKGRPHTMPAYGPQGRPRTLPGNTLGETALKTVSGGEEICIGDCRSCELRPQGRCVKRHTI